jgi:flagellar motor switch protein FliM
MLNNGPDGTIDLRCGGVRLGTGRMGRVGNHVAVRVEQGIRHGKQAAMPAAETKIPDLNVSGGGK